MSRLINRFRLRRRLATRLRNARPGSVLILVVALLVLMALIGTAWLTTAREDRYGSQQNSYNTQVDLLVKAVINLAQSAISDDLFGADGYRATPGTTANSYEHYDATTIEPPPIGAPAGTAGTDHDPFLGSRVPSLDIPTNTPYWPSVSGSPMPGGFVAPYAVLSPSGNKIPTKLPVTFTQRQNLIPSYIDVDTGGGSSTRLPAFDNVTATLADGTTAVCKVLAADTDGDGIADSALFPLLNGNLSGVTYYGTYRIVDNNSAVNVNTAWLPNAVPGQQFFPTNVNLAWLLNPADPDAGGPGVARAIADQIAYLNAYRFTADKTDDTPASPPPPTVSATPVTSAGVARTDFVFGSPDEAFWKQSGSRLANPGFNTVATKYNPLAISEQMRLANKFILKDPYSSRSILEDRDFRLGNSIYDNVLAVGPYAAIDTARWYAENFNYVAQFSNGVMRQMPVRAITVTSNPVSNAMPGRADVSATSGQPWVAGTAYKFGDRVLFPTAAAAGAGQPQHSYVALLDFPATATGTQPEGDDDSEAYWANMSWKDQPSRASVNTASFGELWLAYMGVMDARSPGGTAIVAPFPTAATNSGPVTAPLFRRQFRSPLRDPRLLDPTNLGISGAIPNGMGPAVSTVVLPSAGTFSGVAQMMPDQVLKLRAAIAAVNTIDMRDSDHDVTARRILLKAYVDQPYNTVASSAPAAQNQPPTEQSVAVDVYGYEPQPFITEVYVQNYNQQDVSIDPNGNPLTNPKGYVAIELYNPSSVAINLAGWNLGIVDRRPMAPPADKLHADNSKFYSRYPYLVMQPLTAFTGFPAMPLAALSPPAAPIIAAGDRVILENYALPAEITAWTTAYNAAVDAALAAGSINAAQATALKNNYTTEIAYAAQYRPLSSKLKTPATGIKRYFVPSLHEVMRDAGVAKVRGGELYLLRPRRGDGVLTIDDRPKSPADYNERLTQYPSPEVRQKFLTDLIPLDSFDFFGMEQAPPAPTGAPDEYHVWHYCRQNVGGGNGQWTCPYPGRWDPTTPWQTAAAAAGTLESRQEGVESVPFAFGATDPWNPPAGSAPHAITLDDTGLLPGASANAASSYLHPFGPIQLANEDMPGWNRLINPDGTRDVSPALFTFPYGGFARNGDILQVPFVGAYRIRQDPASIPEFATTTADTDYGTFLSTRPFLEMNPITQDIVFAHDADSIYGATGLHADDADNVNTAAPLAIPTDDKDEQVGRFCPIHLSPRDPTAAVPALAPTVTRIDDFSTVVNPLNWKPYAWALDLFDYLTVQSPQRDFLPDVDPSDLDFGLYNPTPPNPPNGANGGYRKKYPTAFTSLSMTAPPSPAYPTDPNAPEPISNKTSGTFATANNGKDDGAGIEGLININTASAFVLAAVPFVPPDQDNWTYTPGTSAMDTGNVDQIPDNYQIAQAIVYARDVDDGSDPAGPHPHGPFKSLFELNMIYDPTDTETDPLLRRGFRNLWGSAFLPTPVGGDPDDGDGDFSPYDGNVPAPVPTADGVRDDFEERFLMMNRISNLLTTRSDTFTVYLQVQGWRGVGSPSPELVVQRRAAFIADRNSVNKVNRSVTSVNIPVD